jgi:hypothetical protein
LPIQHAACIIVTTNKHGIALSMDGAAEHIDGCASMEDSDTTAGNPRKRTKRTKRLNTLKSPTKVKPEDAVSFVTFHLKLR